MPTNNKPNKSSSGNAPNSAVQSRQDDLIADVLKSSCKVSVTDDKTKTANTILSSTKPMVSSTTQNDDASTSVASTASSNKPTVKPVVRIPSHISTEWFLETHDINGHMDRGFRVSTVYGYTKRINSIDDIIFDNNLQLIQRRLTNKLGFMLVRAVFLDGDIKSTTPYQVIGCMNFLSKADSDPIHNLPFKFIHNNDSAESSNLFFVITPKSKDLQISESEMATLERNLVEYITVKHKSFTTFEGRVGIAKREFKIQLCHMPNSSFTFGCSILIPNELYFSLPRILNIIFPQNKFTICTVLALKDTEWAINCDETDVFNVQLVGFFLRNTAPLSSHPFLNEYKDSSDVLPSEKSLMEQIELRLL
ncbi:unnamed protein product [Ambrosiozyma monospora]|uniref:Unnamed protein product n=1 Tax=Ambrosiozyma monospora TaxID=43982 RepID=A0A9W7DBM0_AMBMO|nr:unnamed protein product [Ambrosiozyma monospora]